MNNVGDRRLCHKVRHLTIRRKHVCGDAGQNVRVFLLGLGEGASDNVTITSPFAGATGRMPQEAYARLW